MKKQRTRIRLLAIIVCICTVLSSMPIVSALDEQVVDSAKYIDEKNGDIYEIQKIERTEDSKTDKNAKGFYTRTYKNQELFECVYVNIEENIIIITDADGSCVKSRVSDVVKITDLDENKTHQVSNSTAKYNSKEPSVLDVRTDYVGSEPFAFSGKRTQATLPGATYYTGYQAMGGRYDSFTNRWGYLQRRNRGYTDTYLAKRFEFSLGTVVSTMVSIVIAVYGGSLPVAIATSLFTTAVGVAVDYAVSAEITVVQFRWDYRVRLTSDSGIIIAEHTRYKDFWEIYVPETESFAYEYRNGYDDGTTFASNEEIIRGALEDYYS